MSVKFFLNKITLRIIKPFAKINQFIIPNESSKINILLRVIIENTKLLFSYGRNCSTLNHLLEILQAWVFGVADYECALEIRKLKMADPNAKSFVDFDGAEYQPVVGVADSESELKIRKLKIADPIWRTEIQKFIWFS